MTSRAPQPVSSPTTRRIVPDERTQAGLDRLAALREGRAGDGPLDLSGLRLVGADLSGLDLTQADLCGADLSRAKLAEANLFAARLAGATLFEAELTRAELSGADLSGANLEAADLTHAGMGLANLRGARLARADLSAATLTEATLREANLQGVQLARARVRNADLSGADLTRSCLRDAELDGSQVAGAVFDGADLRGVGLSGLRGYREASWIGVDLREIDFTGAYLCRGFIMDQNFIEEFRSQSRWSQVIYQVWRLTSDCGRSVTRWAFCTGVLIFLFAWIYTLVGVDFGDYPTPISPLYYSVVTLTTLGYGDVLPSTMAGQIAAMAEVITGYVMLGGLLSIFSNKMASRAS